MQQRPSWLPAAIDLDKPSAARCYDYFLGGSHNFESDRMLARKAEQAVPTIRTLARNNRAFLRRLVRFCVDQGVRQFLDIGSGIPTVGNVHEIAQRLDPGARVVYVDNELVAVTHSEHMLDGDDFATIVHADFADPNAILDAPETRRMLDFDQPVAVLLVALLHFVSEQRRPREVIHQLYERLAPGSLLGLSHATSDDHPEIASPLEELYRDSSDPVTLRTRAEVNELLADFELVEPGVVYLPEWHPESAEDGWRRPSESIIYAGVGRKV